MEDPESNLANSSEPLNKNQFSLQTLLAFMSCCGAGLGFSLAMLPNDSESGLYFLPSTLLGEACIVLAAIAVPCAPIAIVVLAGCLLLPSPRPWAGVAFLIVLVVAVSVILTRPDHPEMLCRGSTAALMFVFFLGVFEVYIKRLKRHYLTIGTAGFLALLYWFFTQFLVVVIHII
jgi:hypothetical protein